MIFIFRFVKKGNGHNGQAFCQYLDKQTADEARSMSKKVYVKGRALIIDSCQGSGKAKNTNIVIV